MAKFDYQYFAFISYKREDEAWAYWFQNELENYHLPSNLNGRDDIPSEFRPVFRDVDELKAGNLPSQIQNALQHSANLVVICSPRAAKSRWVNKEIKEFIKIGEERGNNNLAHVFPFIIEGIPHSNNEKTECFPRVLSSLSKKNDIVGGNINEGVIVSEESRERAFIKVLAGMLPPDISFAMLWNKYERDKIKKERLEREQRNYLLSVQSHYLSEKAISLSQEGNAYLAEKIAAYSLPYFDEHNMRPYVAESEFALRIACYKDTYTVYSHQSELKVWHSSQIAASKRGRHVIGICGKSFMVLDTFSGALMSKDFKTEDYLNISVEVSPNEKQFATIDFVGSEYCCNLWDLSNGNLLNSFTPFFDGQDLDVLFPELDLSEINDHDQQSILDIKFSADGQQIAVLTSFKCTIYNTTDGKEVKRLYHGIGSHMCFSNDGKWLSTTGGIWNIQNGSFVNYNLPDHVCLSLNDSQCYFNTTDSEIGIINKGNLLIIDRQSLQIVKSFHFTKATKSLIFSDFSHVVFEDEEQCLHIHNLLNGKEEDVLRGIEPVSFCLADNDRRLVVYCFSTSLRVYSLESIIKCISPDCLGVPQESIISYSLDCISYASIDESSFLFSALEEEKTDITIEFKDCSKCVRLIGHSKRPFLCVFSSSKDYVLSLSDSECLEWYLKVDTARTRLGDISIINPLRSIPIEDVPQLFAVGNDGTIVYFDGEMVTLSPILGKDSVLFEIKDLGIPAFAISSSKKQILCISPKKTLKIYNYKEESSSIKILSQSEILIKATNIYSLSYILDDQYFLITYSFYRKRYLEVWNIEQARIVFSLNDEFLDRVFEKEDPQDEDYENKKYYKLTAIYDSRAKKIIIQNKVIGTPDVIVQIAVIDYLPIEQLVQKTRSRFKNNMFTKAEKEEYLIR